MTKLRMFKSSLPFNFWINSFTSLKQGVTEKYRKKDLKKEEEKHFNDLRPI